MREMWGTVMPSIATVLILACFPSAKSQVTWGPGPLNLHDTNDLANQHRLHDMLRGAYFMDYGVAGKTAHKLLPAIHEEIAEFRSRANSMPSLALATAMARYNFQWYLNGTGDMDVESVEDAANLMYASIQFSGCARHDLTSEQFFGLACNARWPYTVMLYSELGREFAQRYLTDQAATILEKAIAAFDEMKLVPYYTQFTHWQGPYDINFNEEWYPGARPSTPVWDKSAVPLAVALENNAPMIAAELASIIERGLFDSLHYQGLRAEGQDWGPSEAWRTVELTAVKPSAAKEGETDMWDSAACREAPQTCRLLSERLELRGCQHAATASFVRLQPEGRMKPQFAAAPRLSAHLALRADPGTRMSVGNQTVAWQTGESIVFDDTFIRQEWHAGVRGERYVLQVSFCHPCEPSQRAIYDGRIACAPAATAAQATVLHASSHLPGQSQLSAPGLPEQGAAGRGTAQQETAVVGVPFAAAAAWAATLPDLQKCMQVGEQCPPDSQHGGPNPLSAMNTWNYALNNLRAALRYSGQEIDPAIAQAIVEVQQGIQGFLAMPALERYGPVVETAARIFEALGPWLTQQPPSQVAIPANMLQSPEAVRVPSNGQTPVWHVNFPLANGVAMPAVGFGTWKLEGVACYNAVKWALELGLRHIDTAEAYGNEAEIGRAVKDSGVAREDVFLVTKATSVAMGMAEPNYLEAVFAGQLQALQVEYVDVYMLHAAGVRGEQLLAVWQGMERLLEMGRVRALGVSNFGVEELEELWQLATHKPVYIQNIYKVYKPGEQIVGSSGKGVMQWAQARGVMAVGYSVINSWPHLLPPLEDPHVLSVARATGRTSSQVLHRWCLQHGIAVIPKASTRDRIRENAQLLDFELSAGQMAVLDGLATLSESTHEGVRPSWVPDVFQLGAR